MTDSNTDLLTPDEAASLLGLKKRYLLRLPIPRARIGHRTVRYALRDILEYLDRRSGLPAAAPSGTRQCRSN